MILKVLERLLNLYFKTKIYMPNFCEKPTSKGIVMDLYKFEDNR